MINGARDEKSKCNRVVYTEVLMKSRDGGGARSEKLWVQQCCTPLQKIFFRQMTSLVQVLPLSSPQTFGNSKFFAHAT